MAFSLPIYRKPDFDALELKNAPDARWAYAPRMAWPPKASTARPCTRSILSWRAYGAWPLRAAWTQASSGGKTEGSTLWKTATSSRATASSWAGRKRAQTGFISTQRALKLRKMRTMISSSSGREGAAKRPTRAITIISWSCCATKRSTGTSSGSWDPHLPLTMTRAGRCRS